MSSSPTEVTAQTKTCYVALTDCMKDPSCEKFMTPASCQTKLHTKSGMATTAKMKKAQQSPKGKNLFQKSKAMAREVLKVKWGPHKKMNSHKQWVSALGLSVPDTNKDFGVDFANMPSQFIASSRQSPSQALPATAQQVQSIILLHEMHVSPDLNKVTEDATNYSRQPTGDPEVPLPVPTADEASRSLLTAQSIRSVKTVGLKFFTHRCHICLASFRSKEAVVAHIEGPVHSKQTLASPCHCPYCYFPIHAVSMLKEHLQNSHSHELQRGLITYSGKSVSVDYSNVLKPEMYMQVKPDDVFACQACDQDFDSFHMMHNHLFTKHKSMTTIFCTLCQTTIQETDVVIHALKHSDVPNAHTHIYNRFDGDMSSAFFIISRNVDDDHPLNADPKVKGYRCKFCLYEHDNLNRFKSHIDVHLVASPAKCNNCGDQLRNTSDVYFHYLQHDSSLTSMSLERLIRSQFCCGPTDQVRAQVSSLDHSVADVLSGNAPKVDLLCAAVNSTGSSDGASSGAGLKEYSQRRTYVKIGTNRLSALINEGDICSSNPRIAGHRTPLAADSRPSESTASGRSADDGGGDKRNDMMICDNLQGERCAEPVQRGSAMVLDCSDKQEEPMGKAKSCPSITGVPSTDNLPTTTTQASAKTLLDSSADQTKQLGESTSSVVDVTPGIPDNASMGTSQANFGTVLESSDKHRGGFSIRHGDVGAQPHSDAVGDCWLVSSVVPAEPQRQQNCTSSVIAAGLIMPGIPMSRSFNQIRHDLQPRSRPIQIAVSAAQVPKQFTFSINNVNCKLCKTLCKQHHTPNILDKQPAAELQSKYDTLQDGSSVTGKSFKCLVCCFKTEYCIVIERHVLYHEPLKPCAADMKFKCSVPGCQFATSFQLLYDFHTTQDHAVV